MQTGKVRVFFSEPSKLYGFIQDGNEDIFFHLHRGGRFICDGSEDPVYVKATEELPPPQVGDTLVYEAADSPKGPRAVAWAYLTSLEQADKLIEDRPKFRIYRRTGFLGNSPTYKILWEGRNIADLRERYPNSNPVYIIHNEPQSSLTIQTFEDGEWIDCKDPR